MNLCTINRQSEYLLHMSKYILPAVKHTLALLGVQVEDKICCIVFIGVLISGKKKSSEPPANGAMMILFRKGIMKIPTNLRMRPLFTVVFIFSSRCTTFIYKQINIKFRNIHLSLMYVITSIPLVCKFRSSDLKVTNIARILKDVSSISSRSQAGHGCQVAAVSSHSLNNEHSSFGASSRLLDPIACLKGTKRKRKGHYSN